MSPERSEMSATRATELIPRISGVRPAGRAAIRAGEVARLEHEPGSAYPEMHGLPNNQEP